MSHNHNHGNNTDHSHDHMSAVTPPSVAAWKHDGIRVIPGNQLDGNTAQTPGMDRKAAINFARTGAQKLWAGTVTIHANAKTGAHHHGHLESVIYVVRGRARMRWGEALEFTAEAGPGDFIYVPPYVPHQEINASPTELLECVLCRSDGEAVAVNLAIEPVEKPESVLWVDPTHPQGGVSSGVQSASWLGLRRRHRPRSLGWNVINNAIQQPNNCPCSDHIHPSCHHRVKRPGNGECGNGCQKKRQLYARCHEKHRLFRRL